MRPPEMQRGPRQGLEATILDQEIAGKDRAPRPPRQIHLLRQLARPLAPKQFLRAPERRGRRGP
jgi:hypothetical protein